MTESLVGLILDEGNWLPAAIVLSGIAVVVLVSRTRRQGMSGRLVVVGAMNLFYGFMIGIMSLGHLLAVTVEASLGTLSRSPVVLYPLGLALAVPAWWLVGRAGRRAAGAARWKIEVALNGWLGLYLLALGFHNWPLAAPAALNIAYRFHSRRAVGLTIVAAVVALIVALFIGSLVFLIGGESFE